MAITHATVSVQWAGADSVSVTAGSSQTSTEFNIDDTCVAAAISIKADNSTTPASDDIIYFWLLQTSGDPDADPESADEFDTTGHALLLAVLDTSDEDPAIRTVSLPLPQKGCKLYAEGATAGSTNAVTVSARITEQRSA